MACYNSPRNMAFRIVLRVPKVNEYGVWRAFVKQNPLIDILHLGFTPTSLLFVLL